MTPEERSLLERTHELAQENNKLLTSILRRARLNNALRIAYWVLIIGLSVGAFYFIQPYINFLTNITGNSDTNFSQNLKDLLK